MKWFFIAVALVFLGCDGGVGPSGLGGAGGASPDGLGGAGTEPACGAFGGADGSGAVPGKEAPNTLDGSAGAYWGPEICKELAGNGTQCERYRANDPVYD